MLTLYNGRANGKMNVTLVCQGFDHHTLRLQPWRRVYEMSKRIASKDISVTIITDGHSDQPEETIDKIKIIRIKHLMFAPFFKTKQLRTSILNTNPDLVVWYGTPFSAVYLTQLRSLGKPLIWDIDTDIYTLRFLSRIPHREMFHPANNLFHYLATAVFSKRIITLVANSSFITRIIVPNRHLKSTLCDKGIPSSKIAIVPSAIDVKELNQINFENPKALRGKLGLKPEDFVFTYFGAPNTLRGPDVAIMSVQKILKQRRNVKLLIFSRRRVGSSTPEEEYNRIEEEYLQKLAEKLKVEDHIEIIPGYLDKTLLEEYLHASDAIVLPFRLVSSEPPLSVFEAMSLGKPVVTTDIGGLREIIGKDRGIVVESGNADELAEALLFLARNPEKLAILGKNARQYATTLPNWNDVAQQFAEVLDVASQTN